MLAEPWFLTFEAEPWFLTFEAEPWFLTFEAEVEFRIVMSPEDLKHSGMDKMGKQWG